MTGFDVSIYAIRRRPGRRHPFEVRWRAAGRVRSRSFLTRALADSYRAELVRAGLEFDPDTGEPAAWNQPEPTTVTWYQYAAARWRDLAAHSRSSLADALATVTPALTREDTRRRPDPESCAPSCTGTRSTRPPASEGIRFNGGFVSTADAPLSPSATPAPGHQPRPHDVSPRHPFSSGQPPPERKTPPA
jgi:hypothetical protein